MSITIQNKTDYSYLLSGMTGSTSGVNNNWLSDYASIKNGSYGKLMKAYYGGNASDTVNKLASSSKTSTEAKKTYNKVEVASDELKEAADTLLKGDVFKKTAVETEDENGNKVTTQDYDREAISKAVSSFVDSYNKVLKTADNVTDTTVVRRVENLINQTMVNQKSLNNIGITMNTDGTLSLDKDTLQKADVSKISGVFKGNGSYGYQASAQASLVGYAASNAAEQGTIYNSNGTASSYSTGNLFSRLM